MRDGRGERVLEIRRDLVGLAERLGRCRLACSAAVLARGCGGPDAVGGAREREPARQVCSTVHLDEGVVHGLGAGVAGEVEGRRVADAHEQEIGAEPFLHGARLAVAGEARHGHAFEAASAARAGDGGFGDDADAAGTHCLGGGGLGEGGIDSGVEIDDSRHFDAGVEKVERGLVAKVI